MYWIVQSVRRISSWIELEAIKNEWLVEKQIAAERASWSEVKH